MEDYKQNGGRKALKAQRLNTLELYLRRHYPKIDFEIDEYPLKALDYFVGIEYEERYNQVIRSIKKGGLWYPPIIHRISRRQWLNESELDAALLTPPNRAILNKIQCGNNRVRAARLLGYDSIDCIFVYNLNNAQELCKITRRLDKSWKTK